MFGFGWHGRFRRTSGASPSRFRLASCRVTAVHCSHWITWITCKNKSITNIKARQYLESRRCAKCKCVDPLTFGHPLLICWIYAFKISFRKVDLGVEATPASLRQKRKPLRRGIQCQIFWLRPQRIWWQPYRLFKLQAVWCTSTNGIISKDRVLKNGPAPEKAGIRMARVTAWSVVDGNAAPWPQHIWSFYMWFGAIVKSQLLNVRLKFRSLENNLLNWKLLQSPFSGRSNYGAGSLGVSCLRWSMMVSNSSNLECLIQVGKHNKIGQLWELAHLLLLMSMFVYLLDVQMAVWTR